MRKPPASWQRLIAVSMQLVDSDDRTASVVIETVPPETDYRKVLSIQNAWLNKYHRATARGLIPFPYRIRRHRADDGSYIIEAALDLSGPIEEAMVLWPDEM